MDPFGGLLLALGVVYAIMAARESSGTAVGRAKGTARGRAKGPGGRPPSKRHVSAAERQAALMWWLGEIFHGFPVTRHGLRAGWDTHQHERVHYLRERERRRADHAEEQASWWEDIAAYRRRLEEAARRYREKQQEPAGDPPLPDGTTEGNGPPPDPGQNGHRKRKRRTDGREEDDQGDEPVTTPDNGGSAGADANYDNTLQLAAEVRDAADMMEANQKLAAFSAICDGLAAVLDSTDTETLGMAGDMQGQVVTTKSELAKLKEMAAQMFNHVKKTYGPQQEGVDASGKRAAKAEFTDH